MDKKKEEEAKKEEVEAKEEGEGEDAKEGEEGDASRMSARSKKSSHKKGKRPPTDKQTAYIEFKSTIGKKLEDNIVLSRGDIKSKRMEIKDLTNKINFKKGEIDKLKAKLDKKEEERKASKINKNDLHVEGFEDDDDGHQDDIIDEEEMVFLREMKNCKRDYRDNYSKLKGLKQELQSLQMNIDTSKEQLIY